MKNIKQVSQLGGHTDEVNSVDMRGHLLASGGCDTTVRLWDWRSGQCVALLPGHGGKVWSVSCDLFRVASGGRGGEVRLWSLEDPALSLARSEEVEVSSVVEYEKGRVFFAHTRSSRPPGGQVRPRQRRRPRNDHYVGLLVIANKVLSLQTLH